MGFFSESLKACNGTAIDFHGTAMANPWDLMDRLDHTMVFHGPSRHCHGSATYGVSMEVPYSNGVEHSTAMP